VQLLLFINSILLIGNRIMNSQFYELYQGLEMQKKEFTDEEIVLMAERFKMLSEGSRLKIIRTLFEGEKCVNDIVQATGLLQANVSKQLKLLDNHGIVECRAKGLMRYYKLVDFTVQKICAAVCMIDSK